VIVGGLNPLDRKFLEPVRAAASRYEDRFTITWLTNNSLSEVISAAKDLTFPGNAIFYVSLTLDRSGVYRMPVEALSRIRRVSKVPVYGYHATYLDYGLTGGYMWLMEDLGKLGGELALRVIGGETPADFEKIVLPNAYYLNWTEMERFGFGPDDVPEGATILNRPPAFRDLYWTWTLGGGSLLVALFSLGGFVVVRSRYQARALREENRQRE
jgi:hypothetical protein